MKRTAEFSQSKPITATEEIYIFWMDANEVAGDGIKFNPEKHIKLESDDIAEAVKRLPGDACVFSFYKTGDKSPKTIYYLVDKLHSFDDLRQELFVEKAAMEKEGKVLMDSPLFDLLETIMKTRSRVIFNFMPGNGVTLNPQPNEIFLQRQTLEQLWPRAQGTRMPAHGRGTKMIDAHSLN